MEVSNDEGGPEKTLTWAWSLMSEASQAFKSC